MQVSKGLTFDDVLLVPNYNGIESRKDVNTHVMLGPISLNIPILSANMDTITGPNMADEMARLGGMGILHRGSKPELGIGMYMSTQEPCGVTVGVGLAQQNLVDDYYSWGARIFCVDIAHAHSKYAGMMVKYIKNKAGTVVIAGNVATYAGADYLAGCGADIVKVGIGAGSVCTTREKTGFGVPQLTAIIECARASVPIIADGGIRKPADVVKALAAGATAVMLGGMLAGTDEAAGGNTYRGMASKEAQEDNYGELAEYRAAEGISTFVKLKGPVKAVIDDIMGGLRSGMTYAGARTIAELQRKANFMEVSSAVAVENTPHGDRG